MTPVLIWSDFRAEISIHTLVKRVTRAIVGEDKENNEEKKEEFEEVKLLETEEEKKAKEMMEEELDKDFPDLPVLDKKNQSDGGEEGGGESGEDEFPF